MKIKLKNVGKAIKKHGFTEGAFKLGVGLFAAFYYQEIIKDNQYYYIRGSVYDFDTNVILCQIDDNTGDMTVFNSWQALKDYHNNKGVIHDS